MTDTRIVVLTLLWSCVPAPHPDYRQEYRETVIKYKDPDFDKGKSTHLNSNAYNMMNDKEHYVSFKKTADFVDHQNHKKGKHWTATLNEFSLETEEEFQKHLGVNTSIAEEEHNKLKNKRAVIEYTDEVKRSLSSTVEWKQYLPPVKNQGGCGSCYSFSAMASLEYQVNRKRDPAKEKMTALAEQMCVSCMDSTGCSGAWPLSCYSWSYYHKSHWPSSYNYHYTATAGEKCHWNQYANAMTGMKFEYTNGEHIGGGDDGVALAVANSEIGVVIAMLYAGGGWGSYSSGVFDSEECDHGINHAVAITGYGVLNGLHYFNVRNSWGSGWGDGGYIKMLRGINGNNVNMCRVSSLAYYPYTAGEYDGKGDGTEATSKKWQCADGKGLSYRGTESKTESGRTCQRWDSTEYHSHSYSPSKYPYSGLQENYCRNPDGEPKPWCYTTDTNKRWEFCNIKSCELEKWCAVKGRQIPVELDIGGKTFSDDKDTAKKACYHDQKCTGLLVDKENDKDVYRYRTGASVIGGTKTLLLKGECKATKLDLGSEWCKLEGWTSDASWSPNSWWAHSLEEAKGTCMSATDSYCSGFLFQEKESRYGILRSGNLLLSDNPKDTLYLKGQCPTLPDIANNNKCGDGQQKYYRGSISVTASGRTCQKWTAQEPHEHSRTPEKKPNRGLGDHNYCRNPDNEAKAWCYTTDKDKRFELCDVPLCNPPDYTKCGDGDQSMYRGKIDKTRGGLTCQNWTSQSPYSHDRTPENYPDGGLGNHNYCRNPDGEGSAWCYTTAANKRWDYCSVPKCN